MVLLATTKTELNFWREPDNNNIYLLDSTGHGRFFCTDACWCSGIGQNAAKSKFPEVCFCDTKETLTN